MINTEKCFGYGDISTKKWLPCRSILPFPRGFKGSWVDQCPGGCKGTGVIKEDDFVSAV